MRIEAKSGDNLALTVDRNIQNQTELALKKGIEAAGATEGSVIVMNPKNGQVLARRIIRLIIQRILPSRKMGRCLWIARRWCHLSRDRLSSLLVSLRQLIRVLLLRPARIIIPIVLKSLIARCVML